MADETEPNSILVIEDEADIRTFACRVLELEGYRVIGVEDADAGMDILRGSPSGLVLLDLRLPGRDGWSFLSEMKGDPALSTIPVVVFTATAGTTKKEQALGMGAADYLIKPLSAASLRESISRVLQGAAKG